MVRQTHRKNRSAAAYGAVDTRVCHHKLRRKKISALILDGDQLVAVCFYRAQHGVIDTVEGEFTCKRLQLLPQPMLMPANPAFTPIPLGNDIKTVIFGVLSPRHSHAVTRPRLSPPVHSEKPGEPRHVCPG